MPTIPVTEPAPDEQDTREFFATLRAQRDLHEQEVEAAAAQPELPSENLD